MLQEQQCSHKGNIIMKHRWNGNTKKVLFRHVFQTRYYFLQFSVVHSACFHSFFEISVSDAPMYLIICNSLPSTSFFPLYHSIYVQPEGPKKHEYSQVLPLFQSILAPLPTKWIIGSFTQLPYAKCVEFCSCC